MKSIKQLFLQAQGPSSNASGTRSSAKLTFWGILMGLIPLVMFLLAYLPNGPKYTPGSEPIHHIVSFGLVLPTYYLVSILLLVCAYWQGEKTRSFARGLFFGLYSFIPILIVVLLIFITFLMLHSSLSDNMVLLLCLVLLVAGECIIVSMYVHRLKRRKLAFAYIFLFSLCASYYPYVFPSLAYFLQYGSFPFSSEITYYEPGFILLALFLALSPLFFD